MQINKITSVVKVEVPPLKFLVLPHPQSKQLCTYRTVRLRIIRGKTNLVRRFHPSHSDHRTNNLVLAGDDQHDESKDAELQDTDGVALPKPESEQDSPGTNVGRGVDNASGRCHKSPGLWLF